jgi:hydroxymethylpyrimidine pyrophosphatase-like HAD family hydrolase
MGKADVYPATSGKAQAAAYLAAYYGVPLSSCAFMCDDDNDIELAQRVGKAYCPSISSVCWRPGLTV